MLDGGRGMQEWLSSTCRFPPRARENYFVRWNERERELLSHRNSTVVGESSTRCDDRRGEFCCRAAWAVFFLLLRDFTPSSTNTIQNLKSMAVRFDLKIWGARYFDGSEIIRNLLLGLLIQEGDQFCSLEVFLVNCIRTSEEKRGRVMEKLKKGDRSITFLFERPPFRSPLDQDRRAR